MAHEDAVAVGIDVGGTKLVGLAVTARGEVCERRRVESPRDDERRLLDTIIGLARDLGDDVPTGLAIAGIVARDGTLRYSPNLHLTDVPLRAALVDALPGPVAVLNDATAALAGEAALGAARGRRDVVLLTLGTGVGGGILADGVLVEGANGMGAELGHMVVEDGGRPCPCGNRGCLEAYASGSAIGLMGLQRARAEPDHTTLDEVPVVEGKRVTEAALAGDRVGIEVLREAGYWLGVGLTSLVNVLDPELVVIGGGAASTAFPLMAREAVRVMSSRVIGAPYRRLPDVVPAELGDDAGALGAAVRALALAGAEVTA